MPKNHDFTSDSFGGRRGLGFHTGRARAGLKDCEFREFHTVRARAGLDGL